MAWDTELTKARLFVAATAEFSDVGLAGSRVDRIAAAAGVNKERIYQYFGKKEVLFDAVISAAAAQATDKLSIAGTGPKAIGEYAGRLFDHHAQSSFLARLQFWEGLERGQRILEQKNRAKQRSEQLDALQGALPGIERGDAGDLLLTIITLCDAWPVTQHMDALLGGAMEGRYLKRRTFIVQSVACIAPAMFKEATGEGRSW